jgi:anti-sigma regulatory factor (Ser/Thr protein kinase)
LRELALHLLDIAENSIAAGAKNVQILAEEDLIHDRLRLAVIDDGRGMDAQMVSRVTDPFVTTRTTRKVGLGIPLLKAAADACNGFLKITSTPGKGTRIEVEFQLSHIDRMPLGDLPGTWLTLLVSFPAVHWTFQYTSDSVSFEFDDALLKREMVDLPLTEPSILTFLRQCLQEGVSGVQNSLAVQ